MITVINLHSPAYLNALEGITTLMASQKDNLLYSSKVTKPVTLPRDVIAPFEAAKIKFTLLCEEMDNPNITTIREGFLYSSKPILDKTARIIKQMPPPLPEGKKCSRANVVVQIENSENCVKYDLFFKPEEIEYTTQSEPVKNVIENSLKKLKENNDTSSGILVGVDDCWEMSLVHYMVMLIETSINSNMLEFHANPKLAKILNPRGLMQDKIESLFINASTQDQAYELGDLLKSNNLFQQYEDRFYMLINSLNK